jgi:C1A family cysteine protease
MGRTNKRYGWIPDLPDQRDFVYAAPVGVVRKLPAKTDLRAQCPPVYDQGELGSCTANAIGAAHEFDQLRQSAESKAHGERPEEQSAESRAHGEGLGRQSATRHAPCSMRPAPFIPSRLFVYYNERVMEGTVDEDSGAMLRDGVKSIAKQGVCPETQWPYVLKKYRTRPGPECYRVGLKNQALTYYRVQQTLAQFQGCLAAGYPFVFGFSVYESFESAAVARTGKAPLPKRTEHLIGGHAVMAVGYDDAQKRFLVRNSWGAGWGLKGYFTLPYDYLLNKDLATDFWTIRLVE